MKTKNCFIAGSGDKIALIELETGDELKAIKNNNSDINSIVLTKEENVMVSGSDALILIWHIITSNIISKIEGLTYVINSIELTLDEKSLFLAQMIDQ